MSKPDSANPKVADQNKITWTLHNMGVDLDRATSIVNVRPPPVPQIYYADNAIDYTVGGPAVEPGPEIVLTSSTGVLEEAKVAISAGFLIRR